MIMAGLVSLACMVGYALVSGMIQVQIVDDDEGGGKGYHGAPVRKTDGDHFVDNAEEGEPGSD